MKSMPLVHHAVTARWTLFQCAQCVQVRVFAAARPLRSQSKRLPCYSPRFSRAVCPCNDCHTRPWLSELGAVVPCCFSLSGSTNFRDVLLIKPEESFNPLFKAILQSMPRVYSTASTPGNKNYWPKNSSEAVRVCFGLHGLGRFCSVLC